MTDKQKSNIDKVTSWLNDCRTIRSKESDNILSEMLSLFGKHFDMVQGIAFIKNKKNKLFEQVATYAFIYDENITFEEGEGITGQAIKDKKMVVIKDISIKYFTALSGLGSSNKLELLIIPLIDNNKVDAIIEMAFFKLPDKHVLEDIKMRVTDCYFSKSKIS